MSKDMDFCFLQEIYLWNTNNSRYYKNCQKKVLHKSAEATGEFKGNKIADKIGKPKPVPDKNLRNVEQIIIPPEKRKEILNELRQVL